MQIQIQTPALLFPAASVLLLAYTNRMVALARLVRDLSAGIQAAPEAAEGLRRQIRVLRLRIRLIRVMQFCGVSSVFLCVLTMVLLFFDRSLGGAATFTMSLLLMLASLLISAIEVTLSGRALEIELQRLETQRQA